MKIYYIHCAPNSILHAGFEAESVRNNYLGIGSSPLLHRVIFWLRCWFCDILTYSDYLLHLRPVSLFTGLKESALILYEILLHKLIILNKMMRKSEVVSDKNKVNRIFRRVISFQQQQEQHNNLQHIYICRQLGFIFSHK